MKQKIERSLLAVALMVGLSCAWLGPLDNAGSQVVDSGLKRALVSFASARAMNALLSVVQTTEVSAKPLGFGVSITFGQVVHPINALIGQFAELMLAASVAFGAMKFLVLIGAFKGVSLLLSLVALWWVWLRWHGRFRPAWLSTALLTLVLIRFSVPLVAIGSEAVFNKVLAGKYETAQRGIAVNENGGDIISWLASPRQIPAQVNSFKQSVEGWVGHIVDLIVLFLLQTLVVPLLLFWILYRVFSAMLYSKPQAN